MKRFKHNLSHYKLLSMNQGALVPIGHYHVLPGDTIQQNSTALIRVAPMLAPVMHPVRVRIHHWFVPYRLIWSDWEKFITGGPDGMDASVFPTIELTENPLQETGTLTDYLGLCNLETGQTREVSALPYRAYQLIYNEFYRDQDLQGALPISTASGPDTTTNQGLNFCAWEKDYFTTARDWPAKGPDITIPLAGVVPIRGKNSDTLVYGETDATARTLRLDASTPPHLTTSGSAISGGVQDLRFSSTDVGLEADLENTVDPASILELREAFAVLRYQEARARYGSRYTEYLRYLGVRSSDARLQRPEYLGGGKQTIQFSEVLATAEGTDTEVGDMKGHGISSMRTNRFRRFFEEHGIVMTFMSVIPKTIYMQSAHREWFKRTKEDFWQKELQFIGQQEMLNKEVKLSHTTPDGLFGYVDRYDEYRRLPSLVAGEFRDVLNYWHMARDFSGPQPASDPVLNSTFVEANPTDRIYASTTSDQLYVMANHSIQARRLVAASGGESFVR